MSEDVFSGPWADYRFDKCPDCREPLYVLVDPNGGESFIACLRCGWRN